MRNTLFIVSILSIALLSCGKSEQAAETVNTNSVVDAEETQAGVVSDSQGTAAVMQAAQDSTSSQVNKPAVTEEAVQTAVSEPDISESVTDGETVYKQACISCHMTGAAGAPKLGDASAWQPRIARGVDTLVLSAIAGVPGTAMVAKGACNNCSDDDIRAAVEYMVAQSR
jgi:cytochrome c5